MCHATDLRLIYRTSSFVLDTVEAVMIADGHLQHADPGAHKAHPILEAVTSKALHAVPWRWVIQRLVRLIVQTRSSTYEPKDGGGVRMRTT